MTRVDPETAGLCANCLHARRVTTSRSVFLLCERSRVDSSYERYPRLPMLACPGHEPAPAGEVEGDEPPSSELDPN